MSYGQSKWPCEHSETSFKAKEINFFQHYLYLTNKVTKKFINKIGAGFCDRAQKQCRPLPAISEEGELRSAVFCQVTGVHLMCQIFMNDLLTEQG